MIQLTSEARQAPADSIGMKELTPQTKRIDERTFRVVRKGFDPREVKTYLDRRVELERQLTAARATERASLDNAMMAVFDVKDRMIDRAERRAREIQDEADKSAGVGKPRAARDCARFTSACRPR